MGKIDSKIMSLAKAIVPGLAGLIQLYYGEPNPGWASLKDNLAHGWEHATYAPHTIVASMTGVRLAHLGQEKTEFDVLGTLNPFDLRNAPVPKVILLSRLALEGISAVGQFISSIFKDLLK